MWPFILTVILKCFFSNVQYMGCAQEKTKKQKNNGMFFVCPLAQIPKTAGATDLCYPDVLQKEKLIYFTRISQSISGL